MMNVLNFVMNYWYVIGVVVLVVGFFALKHMAKSKAKDTIMKYFKEAEKMVFENTDAKLTYVSQAAYVALPKAVKTLISPALFTLLVKEVYDGVKDLVEKK